MTDDVPKVAEALDLDPSVVDVAKRNLFVNKHDVAVGGGDIVHGYFTADDYIAGLWKSAIAGKLKIPNEFNELRSVIAHEYVEAKLMEAGVPYNYADPRLWDDVDGYGDSTEHVGAHTVAPRALQATSNLELLLSHWEGHGLTPPPGGLAPDLSNLDDIVRRAIEGMGW
jgi:hypothetical protein